MKVTRKEFLSSLKIIWGDDNSFSAIQGNGPDWMLMLAKGAAVKVFIHQLPETSDVENLRHQLKSLQFSGMFDFAPDTKKVKKKTKKK